MDLNPELVMYCLKTSIYSKDLPHLHSTPTAWIWSYDNFFSQYTSLNVPSPSYHCSFGFHKWYNFVIYCCETYFAGLHNVGLWNSWFFWISCHPKFKQQMALWPHDSEESSLSSTQGERCSRLSKNNRGLLPSTHNVCSSVVGTIGLHSSGQQENQSNKCKGSVGFLCVLSSETKLLTVNWSFGTMQSDRDRWNLCNCVFNSMGM